MTCGCSCTRWSLTKVRSLIGEAEAASTTAFRDTYL